MFVFPENRLDIIPPGFKIKTYTKYRRDDQLYDIAATSGINIKEHVSSLIIKVNSFYQMGSITCQWNFLAKGIIQYQSHQINERSTIIKSFILISRDIYSALSIENMGLSVGKGTETMVTCKDDHCVAVFGPNFSH
jgi:hypothetical protein